MKNGAVNTAGVPTVEPKRVAIYTRKSTDKGLERDFNSLDAQREACEQYIKSQAHLGWTLTGTRYDDGGFTGANIDRSHACSPTSTRGRCTSWSSTRSIA